MHPTATDFEPLGLSTAWNGASSQDAQTILDGHQRLGFTRLEAYMHFTPTQLEALNTAARERGCEIASLHSPCPLPVSAAGYREGWADPLASINPAERQRAIDALRRTIDTAAQIGARAIVVHLGHTGVVSRQRAVFEAVERHGRNSDEHRRVLEQAVAEREARKGPALDAALDTMRQLGEHAAGTPVRLGVEIRDNYHEIPSLDEFEQVFAACDGLPVYYWHDAGHGAKQQYGGFAEHEAFLRRYGDRLLGMHIHDTRGSRDHQAPGQGETDFGMLARYLRPETFKTVELHPTATFDQVAAGLELLRQWPAYGVERSLVYQV